MEREKAPGQFVNPQKKEHGERWLFEESSACPGNIAADLELGQQAGLLKMNI